MNEFIVWDEDNEKFIDESQCILSDGTLYSNHRHNTRKQTRTYKMNNTILIYQHNQKEIVRNNISLDEENRIIAENDLVDYYISTVVKARGSYNILEGEDNEYSNF